MLSLIVVIKTSHVRRVLFHLGICGYHFIVLFFFKNAETHSVIHILEQFVVFLLWYNGKKNKANKDD